MGIMQRTTIALSELRAENKLYGISYLNESRVKLETISNTWSLYSSEMAAKEVEIMLAPSNIPGADLTEPLISTQCLNCVGDCCVEASK